MKRITLFLLIFIALAMCSTAYAENQQTESLAKAGLQLSTEPVPEAMKQKMDEMFLAGDGGNDYYIIFPPNDLSAATANGSNMSLLIGATKKGTPIYFDRNGVRVWEGIIPTSYGTVVLCCQPGPKNGQVIVDVEWEIKELDEDTPVDKGFRVYTDEEYDIYVYLGNFRSATADGYMALPTTGLGNRYIHCSRTDNYEGGGNAAFRTGFAAIAVYPDTKLTCKLMTTQEFCITANGKKAGTMTSPTLAQGQVWVIMNGVNDIQNSVCDFSGSVIYGDKNFALISFLQRTAIPVSSWIRNRDNLCEQLLPVTKWGTKHVSVQFKGAYEKTSIWKNGNPLDDNPGQLYRVVAREPETVSNAIWYDLTSMESVGTWNVTLHFEGDWVEYIPIASGENSAKPIHSIMGACYWEATHPVQLLCYQTTEGFFYNGDSDPLMLLIPPVEQYGNNTSFITAASNSSVNFTEHAFTLYAEGAKLPNGDPDTLDFANIREVLSSITIRQGEGDNAPTYKVNNKDATFFANRIPGTNYYFARWNVVDNTPYRVEGRTRLSGSVYGWGSVISYGWPASMKLVATQTNDNLPPEVFNGIECNRQSRPDMQGRIIISAEWIDTTDWDKSEWEDKQQDMGINKAPQVIYDATNNLQLYRYYFFDKDSNQIAAPSSQWRTGTYFKRGKVEFTLNDPFVDVYAAIKFEDGAGNETIDTIIYKADKIGFIDADGNALTGIDFGSLVLGNKYYDTLWITNLDTTAGVVVNVDSIFLPVSSSDNGAFEIAEGKGVVTLGPGQRHRIIISYTPQSSATVSNMLEIYTSCLYFEIPVFGGAGLPRIRVTDCGFGQVFVSTTAGPNTIEIENLGSMDLVVTGYYFEPEQQPNGPFFYTAPNNNPYPTEIEPWTIPANSTASRKIVRNLTYTPYQIGPATTRLYFITNADPELDPTYKDYAVLTGEGITTGPKLTNYDWDERRVKTVNTGEVLLINEGNTSITLADFPEINGWHKRNDTLFSADNSYAVPNYSAYIGTEVMPHGNTDLPIEDRELVIYVLFVPQSEQAPVGTCPVTESFYINFTPASQVENNTIYSVLSGIGILPHIDPTGYTFATPALMETTSSEVGFITIKNPSKTAVLKVRSIVFVPGLQESDFIPQQPLASFAGTIIAKEDSLVIPVNFHPLNTTPPNRLAKVTINSDAETGPNVDPVKLNEVELRAISFDEGLEVGGINYLTLTRCDSPTLPITVTNMSTTTSLTITNVEVEPAYRDLFIFQNPVQNIEIPPNSSYQINVKFNPCIYTDESGNPAQGQIDASVTVISPGQTQVTRILANPIIIPVTASLPTITGRESGQVIEMPINISIPQTIDPFFTFDNANITSFDMVLNAPKEAINFEGFASTNGWNFSYKNVGTDNVTIHGEGKAIGAAGVFVTPTVRILVSQYPVIPINIVSINFPGRECCILPSTESGSISWTICAQDVRGGIITDSEKFYLNAVSPNPVSTGNIDIEYGVGFDVNTTIEIYNAAGSLVRTVYNGMQVGGAYSANVDVTNLSSGAYTIIMKSGPFEETQSLIILK
ncbi:MAG: T9SS type A sorting domain-containing protein [Ignavibacteria bacterium]|jgi:hypothetical protein|nr:T9SS type A sorting domain-containing protein [Ignavibacteria bacterium]